MRLNVDLEKKSYFYLVFYVVYKSVGCNRENWNKVKVVCYVGC